MGATLEELAKRLGSDRVVTGEAVAPRYRSDALRAHRGSLIPEGGVPPAGVVRPRSTEEVSTVVRFAAHGGMHIVPWGGGTGLMGGARADRDSIVLDLRGMRRIRATDVESCTVSAESGIVLERLNQHLRKHGLLLGHDPWSRPRATLGGAIGTNGIGYGGFLRGTMGDQVLGLEAVLADGSVVRTRPAVRSTTGLDLKRLFIGTEGTFGIVTAATLRVFPIPEKEEIHAFSLPDFPSGLAGLARIYGDHLVPSVMDFEETFESPGLPWRTEVGPPTLYLGFAGSRDIVSASWRVARRHLRAGHAVSLPDRDARAYWKSRHDIIYMHDEVAPGTTRADIALKDTIFDYVHVALPRSKVLGYRRAALALLRRRRVQPIGLGLWTQPELVSIEIVRAVEGDRDAAKRSVAEVIDDLIRKAHQLGGSMEYVHGIGVKLAHLMGEELGPGLDVARRVKHALDPNDLLNPGKLGL